MQGYYPFSLDKQHTEAALPLVQPLERYAPGTERYVRGMHLWGYVIMVKKTAVVKYSQFVF